MPRGLVALAVGALAAPAGVRELDAAGVEEITRSSGPWLVRFDPAESADACAALDPAWERLAAEFPGVLARVDCARSAEACAARKINADAAIPVFKFWSSEGWRKHVNPDGGAPTEDGLRDYLRRKLAPRGGRAGQRATPQAAPRQPILTHPRVPLAVHAAAAALVTALAYFIVTRGHWRADDFTVVAVGAKPAGGAESLYLFRLGAKDGTLTPLSYLPRSFGHVAALVARPRREGGYFVDAAIARDESCASTYATEGGADGAHVLTLALDARAAPCVQPLSTAALSMRGAPNLAAGTTTAPGGGPVVACGDGGAIALLRPCAERKLRGMLEACDEVRAASPPRSHASSPAARRPVVRPPSAAPAVVIASRRGGASSHALVVDTSSGGLRLISVAEPTESAESVALREAARTRGVADLCGAALVRSPHDEIVYVACPDGRVGVVDLGEFVGELPSDAPLTVAWRVDLGSHRRPDGGSGGGGGVGLCTSSDGCHVYAALPRAAGAPPSPVAILRATERGRQLELVGHAALPPLADAGEAASSVDEPDAPHDGTLVLSLAHDDSVLIVADRAGQTLHTLRRDGQTGALSPLRAVPCAAPQAVLALRWPPPAC